MVSCGPFSMQMNVCVVCVCFFSESFLGFRLSHQGRLLAQQRTPDRDHHQAAPHRRHGRRPGAAQHRHLGRVRGLREGGAALEFRGGDGLPNMDVLEELDTTGPICPSGHSRYCSRKINPLGPKSLFSKDCNTEGTAPLK